MGKPFNTESVIVCVDCRHRHVQEPPYGTDAEGKLKGIEICAGCGRSFGLFFTPQERELIQAGHVWCKAGMSLTYFGYRSPPLCYGSKEAHDRAYRAFGVAGVVNSIMRRTDVSAVVNLRMQDGIRLEIMVDPVVVLLERPDGDGPRLVLDAGDERTVAALASELIQMIQDFEAKSTDGPRDTIHDPLVLRLDPYLVELTEPKLVQR